MGFSYWWLTVGDDQLIQALAVTTSALMQLAMKRGSLLIYHMIRINASTVPRPFNNITMAVMIENGYMELV